MSILRHKEPALSVKNHTQIIEDTLRKTYPDINPNCAMVLETEYDETYFNGKKISSFISTDDNRTIRFHFKRFRFRFFVSGVIEYVLPTGLVDYENIKATVKFGSIRKRNRDLHDKYDELSKEVMEINQNLGEIKHCLAGLKLITEQGFGIGQPIHDDGAVYGYLYPENSTYSQSPPMITQEPQEQMLDQSDN